MKTDLEKEVEELIPLLDGVSKLLREMGFKKRKAIVDRAIETIKMLERKNEELEKRHFVDLSYATTLRRQVDFLMGHDS